MLKHKIKECIMQLRVLEKSRRFGKEERRLLRKVILALEGMTSPSMQTLLKTVTRIAWWLLLSQLDIPSSNDE